MPGSVSRRKAVVDLEFPREIAVGVSRRLGAWNHETLTTRDLPPLPGVDPATAPDPEDPVYAAWVESVAISPEGIDRTQIWESLHRTPAERLAVLERVVRDFFELTGGHWPEIR